MNLITSHWLCLLSLCIISANGKDVLRQVHVISRHGSRSLLPKNGVTLDEGEDDSFLTSNGQRQLYDLGMWLRERYLNEGIIDSYDSRKVRLESSSFQRTLVSASSLALGLFPRDARLGMDGATMIPETPANVPVYTHGHNDNDVTIRAYDKCYAFSRNLDRLYRSESWKEMETHFIPILVKLAEIPQFQVYAKSLYDKYRSEDRIFQRLPTGATTYIPLEEVWNIYDYINVQKIECGDANLNNSPDSICSNSERQRVVADIPDNDWETIKEMTSLSELHKYGKNDTAAGNLIGSNIITQILARMEEDPDIRLYNDGRGGGSEASVNDDKRFYLYSGHYPTILGVYSALDQLLEEPYQMADEIIPGYASALIFEFYQDDETHDRNMQIYYKPSEMNRPVPVRLTHGKCFNQVSCSFENVQEVVSSLVISDHDTWCTICDNREADVCVRAEREHFLNDEAQSWGQFFNMHNGGGGRHNSGLCTAKQFEATAILIGVGGALAGTFVTVCLVACIMRRKQRLMDDNVDDMDAPPIGEEGADDMMHSATVNGNSHLVDVQLNNNFDDNNNNGETSSSSKSPTSTTPPTDAFLDVPEVL